VHNFEVKQGDGVLRRHPADGRLGDKQQEKSTDFEGRPTTAEDFRAISLCGMSIANQLRLPLAGSIRTGHPVGANREVQMSKIIQTASVSRRSLLQGTSAGVLALIAAPAIVRAQARELVVGGAASHKVWVDPIVIPAFEKKYNCKIVYEGTRSLVNLEKMQKNKDRQYLSVVQMDDPVMILAVKEGVLEQLTPAKVPNLANLKPGTIHMDGMWANYLQPWCGIAYNTKAMSAPPKSWADLFDPKYKGRIILPSLQNTEGLPNLFMAAHLETGKPIAEAQKDAAAAFNKLAKLKPNLLTVYTQMPQAFNLLEQGEAFMIASAQSSFALERKAAGAPIDIAAPREGVFPMPSGVAVVKGAPQMELALAYVNELLGADIQSKLVGPTYSLPTNTAVAPPPGFPEGVVVHPIDWGHVAQERNGWVQRWDREMAL
jgi:putative spermidine/putrescine transport system substrate-binding protein